MATVKNINITGFSQKKTYERPEKTYTDTIQSNEEMQKKLIDYTRVDSIDEVPLNTHVRYVTLSKTSTHNEESKKIQRFCMGGFLIKKFPDYVILKNTNNISWCVQKYHWDTTDGRKNTDEEIEPIFTTIFFKKKGDVEKLEDALEELSDINKETEEKYINQINELESKYQKLLQQKTEEIEDLQSKVHRLVKFIKSNE